MSTLGRVVSRTLLNGVTATGAGTSVNHYDSRCTFQAAGTTTAGAGAATILVQVSNDNTNWLTAGTITLTLSTTSSTDGFILDAKWVYIRGNITAISGTGASVSLVMGN